jgi:hypothetical protein
VSDLFFEWYRHKHHRRQNDTGDEAERPNGFLHGASAPARVGDEFGADYTSRLEFASPKRVILRPNRLAARQLSL